MIPNTPARDIVAGYVRAARLYTRDIVNAKDAMRDARHGRVTAMRMVIEHARAARARAMQMARETRATIAG